MKTVVAALIKRDNQYLLAKRLTGNPDLVGQWEFPGGKVKLGETDEGALEREILEEFNTLVTVGKLRATAEIDPDRILKLYDCQHKLGSYQLRAHSEAKWLSLTRIKDYNLAPADALLVERLTHGEKAPQLSRLKIGERYTNSDITEIFVVSSQGGMRKSNRANSLVLIIRHDSGNPYDDRWDNGEIRYTGMGLNGDQSVEYKQNKTLAESGTNGIEVHLFESYDEPDYVYHGQVELSGEPYYEMQNDESGKPRRVVKFPLRLKK